MSNPETDKSLRASGNSWRWIVNLSLSILIVAAGIAGAAYIKNTTPEVQKRPAAGFVPLVETIPLAPADHRVVIPAMGTVAPSRKTALRSRVSGQVVWLHPEFLDGGVVAAGDALIRLEDQDYKLAVAQKESTVVDAEYRLEIEMGHQDVAQLEWEILNDGKSSRQEDVALALRKPHLAKAQADLEAATADLAQARLNLERTVIRAPYNAVVRSKTVDLGSQVGFQDTLAELVGIDFFWVETTVRVDHLQWIDIPETNGGRGAAARVRYRNGFFRDGEVIRLLKSVDTDGRMARIIVAVKNPLGQAARATAKPPMLLGEYVRVEISGKTLPNVYSIPRAALRDNAYVWIVKENETLDIRPVTPLWRGPDAVLVRDGIAAGERLVVSALANPVQGMTLTTRPAGGTPAAEKTPDAS